MQNKKQALSLLIISILVVTIGITYAYYSAVVQGTGNTNAEASARTATIGEVEFNGENTFDTTNIGRDIYPGFIGVQKFTIGPYRDGHGVYEIDLEANVPVAFNNDIKLTIYKTSDATNNNIDSEEGSLTVSNNRYVKQDNLLITGNLMKVYEGPLKNTDETVLEQVEFNIDGAEFETPDTTPDGFYTYYAVYEYLDNGNQNEQQGLDFSSKITVKYVLEVTDLARETLESLQALDNTLTVTPSTTTNPDFIKVAPQTSAGQSYTGWPMNGNYYVTYGDDVTYDSATGVYTLTNPVTCQWSACYQQATGNYAIPTNSGFGQEDSTPFIQSSESIMNNAVVHIDYATVSTVSVIMYQGSELNNVKTGVWAPQTSGLFELEDDYGTSYYFRGDVDNNYVKFGGFYWRIVRINGDGSIRMIYAGDASVIDGLANKAEVLANGYDDSSTKYTEIGTSAFNSSYNDNAYVGYMYGTVGSDNYADTHANTNNNTIKTYIDTWYENNIKNTANEAYIADSIFCNDRSIASAETINYANTNLGGSYTTNAFGTNWTIYGAWGRQIEQFNQGLGNRARLTCPNKNDAFTVSDTTKGNGALTYPIGLITTDEANIAGGAGENNNYYLTTGNWYWTGSPFDYGYGSASVKDVDADGSIGNAFHVDEACGVRPVINLKSGSLSKGSGTASNPYEVE